MLFRSPYTDRPAYKFLLLGSPVRLAARVYFRDMLESWVSRRWRHDACRIREVVYDLAEFDEGVGRDVEVGHFEVGGFFVLHGVWL